jgi:hypothetical protein
MTYIDKQSLTDIRDVSISLNRAVPTYKLTPKDYFTTARDHVPSV